MPRTTALDNVALQWYMPGYQVMSVNKGLLKF